jgi:acyl-CoA thioesterase-1
MRVWIGCVLGVALACGQPTPEDTGRTAAESAGSRAGEAADRGQGPDSAFAQDAAPDGERRTGPTVLIVGTSLTAGYGLASPDFAYPAILQRMSDSAGYGVRIVNAGLSGETSAGALRRLDWILRDTADFVIVETGANDGLRGLNVDSTRANLRRIVDRLRAEWPQAQIALVQMESPPNLGVRYTGAFRESFRTVAREKDVMLLPFLLDGVAGVPRLNQGDGIHPNAEGAKIVAQTLWRAIEPTVRTLARRPS